MRHILSRSLLVVLAMALAACGSVAQPVWEQAGTATADAAVRAANATAIALGLPSPTPVPPSATPLPPTATALPTETSTPAPTEPPTAMPTLAPTLTSATGNAASILPPGFEAAYAAANPADGQTVYSTQFTTVNGVWMCSQCHSVTPDEARLIGPGLYNVAVRGETRREGMDALSYIYNSITHPSEYLAPGEPPYPDGLMPQNYAEVLTEEQLASLIAYLFTLQG